MTKDLKQRISTEEARQLSDKLLNALHVHIAEPVLGDLYINKEDKNNAIYVFRDHDNDENKVYFWEGINLSDGTNYRTPFSRVIPLLTIGAMIDILSFEDNIQIFTTTKGWGVNNRDGLHQSNSLDDLCATLWTATLEFLDSISGSADEVVI